MFTNKFICFLGLYLSFSFTCSAQNDQFNGTWSYTEVGKKVELEYYLKPKNGYLGKIFFEDSGCLADLQSVANQPNFLQQINTIGKCENPSFIYLRKSDDKVQYLATKVYRFRGGPPKPQFDLQRSQPSDAFIKAISDSKSTKNYFWHPNRSKQTTLNLDEFDRFHKKVNIENQKQFLEFYAFSDLTCAKEKNAPDERLSSIKLGQLIECKFDLQGFKRFVDKNTLAEVRDFLRGKPDINNPSFAKALLSCAESKAVEVVFDDLSKVAGIAGMPKSLARASRSCFQIVSALENPSDYLEKNSYKIYSKHLVEWTANPNYTENKIDKLKSQMPKVHLALSEQLALYKDYDIQGLYIGQSLSQVAKILPNVGLETHVNFPVLAYPADSSSKINSVLRLTHLDGRGIKSGRGASAEYLAANWSLNVHEASMMRDFKTLMPTFSQEDVDSIDSIADVLFYSYNPSFMKVLQWNKKNIGEVPKAFADKNIVSIEISINPFQQVTGINLTREFNGIADLKELSGRLINKYKGLGLKPPKFKTAEARIESKNHYINFYIRHHEKTTGGTTSIMYSIEPNISPIQLYPHVLPIVRYIQIWALDKYKPETVDGSNIAL